MNDWKSTGQKLTLLSPFYAEYPSDGERSKLLISRILLDSRRLSGRDPICRHSDAESSDRSPIIAQSVRGCGDQRERLAGPVKAAHGICVRPWSVTPGHMCCGQESVDMLVHHSMEGARITPSEPNSPRHPGKAWRARRDSNSGPSGP